MISTSRYHLRLGSLLIHSYRLFLYITATDLSLPVVYNSANLKMNLYRLSAEHTQSSACKRLKENSGMKLRSSVLLYLFYCRRRPL